MSIRTYDRAPVSTMSRRKERYGADPRYRLNAKITSRKAYRKKAGVELQNCLYSLTFLDAAAATQEVVFPDGRVREAKVLSVPKTAEMLQTLYQTLWRWVSNGLVPSPVIQSVHRNHPVYHVDEVRVLVEEIGAHQKSIKYLRRDHTEVIDTIEQRIAEIRKKLFKK